MNVKHIMVNTPWGVVENGMRFHKLSAKLAKPVIEQLKERFKKCGHCGAVGKTVRCMGCEQHYYCNEVCQRADWDHHRVFCKSTSKGRKQRPFRFLASFVSYKTMNPSFISFGMLSDNRNVLDTTHCLWVVTTTDKYYEMRPQTIEVWNALVASFGEKWATSQKALLQKGPCFHVAGKGIVCYVE